MPLLLELPPDTVEPPLLDEPLLVLPPELEPPPRETALPPVDEPLDVGRRVS